MRFLLFIALALLPLSAAIECWVGSQAPGSKVISNKQCSGSFCSYVNSGGTTTWSCGNQCSQTGCTNGPAKRDTVITGAGAAGVHVKSTNTRQQSSSTSIVTSGPSAPVVTTTCCCAYAKCNLSKESAEAPAPANSGGHGSHGGNANTANGPSASAESDSAAAPALLLTAAATAAIVGARL